MTGLTELVCVQGSIRPLQPHVRTCELLFLCWTLETRKTAFYNLSTFEVKAYLFELTMTWSCQNSSHLWAQTAKWSSLSRSLSKRLNSRFPADEKVPRFNILGTAGRTLLELVGYVGKDTLAMHFRYAMSGMHLHLRSCTYFCISWMVWPMVFLFGVVRVRGFRLDAFLICVFARLRTCTEKVAECCLEK